MGKVCVKRGRKRVFSILMVRGEKEGLSRYSGRVK